MPNIAMRPLRLRPFFIPLAIVIVLAAPQAAFAASPTAVSLDAILLDKLQRQAFLSMWEGGHPNSGLAMEAQGGDSLGLGAVGGTGFGLAAIVVAVDRGWISRVDGVERIGKILLFLRDKTPRNDLRGAFPHWVDGNTGKPIAFSPRDDDADIVETALLVQGMLIARAYFDGQGKEADLRRLITQMWEEVDWDWFTAGEEDGLHWHYSPEHGHSGLKIRGFNECMIAYILALSSPTHPISQKSYQQWTRGEGYQPKEVFGYKIEAALDGGGPLFLTHYSFIGLDPRRMSDSFAPNGYFVRNVRQTLSNRGYCLQSAPRENGYSEGFWGLTASRVKGGYAVNEPLKDSGTVAPTAALSSMPYTPHYSMQVLEALAKGQNKAFAALSGPVWGPYGPYDAISLRDKWVSTEYLAIDQLPIVCMVENYRSGLLWRLFMSDPDIKRGLEKAGIKEPGFAQGFPEAVVTLKKTGQKYEPDALDLRRHPDTGLYGVPFWLDKAGKVGFTVLGPDKKRLAAWDVDGVQGRNLLAFKGVSGGGGKALTLVMRDAGGREHTLPVRLH